MVVWSEVPMVVLSWLVVLVYLPDALEFPPCSHQLCIPPKRSRSNEWQEPANPSDPIQWFEVPISSPKIVRKYTQTTAIAMEYKGKHALFD